MIKVWYIYTLIALIALSFTKVSWSSCVPNERIIEGENEKNLIFASQISHLLLDLSGQEAEDETEILNRFFRNEIKKPYGFYLNQEKVYNGYFLLGSLILFEADNSPPTESLG